MRYLLDTDIVSDLIRNPQGSIAHKIRTVGEQRVCTSIIVAAELRYGAAKRQSPRLTAQLEAVLGALEVLPYESPADVAYGALRARLEKASRPIGGNDLLIAAHALALGYTIVSDNEREFAGIPGLSHENWLAATVISLLTVSVVDLLRGPRVVHGENQPNLYNRGLLQPDRYEVFRWRIAT